MTRNCCGYFLSSQGFTEISRVQRNKKTVLPQGKWKLTSVCHTTVDKSVKNPE